MSDEQTSTTATIAAAWRAVGRHPGITISADGDDAAETWNSLCRLLDPLVMSAGPDENTTASRINVANYNRLTRALAWVDEVYPCRNRDGAAIVEMTWEQWNGLREALGLPAQPIPPRKRA